MKTKEIDGEQIDKRDEFVFRAYHYINKRACRQNSPLQIAVALASFWENRELVQWITNGSWLLFSSTRANWFIPRFWLWDLLTPKSVPVIAAFILAIPLFIILSVGKAVSFTLIGLLLLSFLHNYYLTSGEFFNRTCRGEASWRVERDPLDGYAWLAANYINGKFALFGFDVAYIVFPDCPSNLIPDGISGPKPIENNIRIIDRAEHYDIEFLQPFFEDNCTYRFYLNKTNNELIEE